MDKLNERISALEERLRALKAQQNRTAARARTLASRRERKEDTRRKILAGAWVLHQLERGEMPREGVMAALDRFLVRPEDRALFDLPVAPPRVDALARPTEEAGAPVSPAARRSA